MLMGVLLNARKYSAAKYLRVVLMTAGVALFMYHPGVRSENMNQKICEWSRRSEEKRRRRAVNVEGKERGQQGKGEGKAKEKGKMEKGLEGKRARGMKA